MVERIIQHKAPPSAVLALETTTECVITCIPRIIHASVPTAPAVHHSSHLVTAKQLESELGHAQSPRKVLNRVRYYLHSMRKAVLYCTS